MSGVTLCVQSNIFNNINNFHNQVHNVSLANSDSLCSKQCPDNVEPHPLQALPIYFLNQPLLLHNYCKQQVFPGYFILPGKKVRIKNVQLVVHSGRSLQSKVSCCISFWSTKHTNTRRWVSFEMSDSSSCYKNTSAYPSVASSHQMQYHQYSKQQLCHTKQFYSLPT